MKASEIKPGMRFGRLEVLAVFRCDTSRYLLVECMAHCCGKFVQKRADALALGQKSCGGAGCRIRPSHSTCLPIGSTILKKAGGRHPVEYTKVSFSRAEAIWGRRRLIHPDKRGGTWVPTHYITASEKEGRPIRFDEVVLMSGMVVGKGDFPTSPTFIECDFCGRKVVRNQKKNSKIRYCSRACNNSAKSVGSKEEMEVVQEKILHLRRLEMSIRGISRLLNLPRTLVTKAISNANKN